MVLVNIIAYKIITHLYLFNNYIIYNVIDSIPIGQKNQKLVYFFYSLSGPVFKATGVCA